MTLRLKNYMKSSSFHSLLNKSEEKLSPTIELTNSFEKKQYKHIESLDKKTIEALFSYTTTDYIDLHKYIDKNINKRSNQKLEKKIELIDKAIRSAPKNSRDITVYKGFDLSKESFDLFRARFTSVSLDKRAALKFTGNNKCCLLKIKIPKDSNILIIYTISHIPHEKEILIPKNSYIHINNIKLHDNMVIYEASLSTKPVITFTSASK